MTYRLTKRLGPSLGAALVAVGLSVAPAAASGPSGVQAGGWDPFLDAAVDAETLAAYLQPYGLRIASPLDDPTWATGGAPVLDGRKWDPAPHPPYGQWITSPELPGWRMQVRFGWGEGGTRTRGWKEADCIPETVCVSGALRGRPEIFIKVIGPRPNGFLWLQVPRFTPSGFEIWFERPSRGQWAWYALNSTTVLHGQLVGIEDREFSPP